jgi:oligo-1,6-glucosidase
MQWSDTTEAGFTNGTPWIKVNPNYTTVNVTAEEKDPNSILNYFKKMVRLRKTTPTLIYGRYELLDKDNPSAYCYTRTGNGKKILVLLNFKAQDAKANTGLDLSKAKILIGNYTDPSLNGNLRPYEAIVMEIN